MDQHQHQHDCPETVEHATETPLYDAAAFAAGFAPVPTVEQLRAEYERQVAARLAAGGTR